MEFNPFMNQEKQLNAETEALILKNLEKARFYCKIACKVVVFGMSVVIFNSFTQPSLADIPIHAKLTIPLCLLVFSLISFIMLLKF
jgi:hypothetical protein